MAGTMRSPSGRILSGRSLAGFRSGAVALAALLAVSGCTSMQRFVFGAPAEGVPGHVAGFLGGVAADEPRAAVVAREVLSSGGNAVDAATALGFALAVTLPSRAGLGGGGACLVYRPGAAAETVMFMSQPPKTLAGSADRPAAAPAVPAGLLALHARYGHLKLDRLTAPAEEMARFGVPVSAALSRDLHVVARPLLADAAARTVFGPRGEVLDEGGILVQPDLGVTLAQLRIGGQGDFYRGALAHAIVAAATSVGGGLTAEDLAGVTTQTLAPIIVPDGPLQVAFLPLPADGGLAAAGAWRVLSSNPTALADAALRSEALAARWRSGGGDAKDLLASQAPPARLPDLSASTGFVVLDPNGMAVACAETMGNLFGIGRIAPGTGLLLAASPATMPPPLLSAAIAWDARARSFRAAAASSGQSAAPLALAIGLRTALHAASPIPTKWPPDPGRLALIACPGGLPGDPETCKWATDPRGKGLALGEKSDRELEQERGLGNPEKTGEPAYDNKDLQQRRTIN